jgi:hypothetical protein
MNSYTRKTISTLAMILTAGNSFAAQAQSLNSRNNIDNVESLRRDLKDYTRVLIWCRNGHIEYQPQTGEMKIQGNGVSVNRIKIGEEERVDPSFLDVIYYSRRDLFQGKSRPSPQIGEELQISADSYTIKARTDNLDLFTITRENPKNSPIEIGTNPNSDVYRPKPKIISRKLTQQTAKQPIAKLEHSVYSRDTTNISATTNKTLNTKLLPRKTIPKNIYLPNVRRELAYRPTFNHRHIDIPNQQICFDYRLADSPIGSINIDSLEIAISQERINEIAQEVLSRNPMETFAMRTISNNNSLAYDTTKVEILKLVYPVIIENNLEQIVSTNVNPNPKPVIHNPVVQKPKENNRHSTRRNVILGIVGASAGYMIVDAITPEKSSTSNQKPNESPPGIH